MRKNYSEINDKQQLKLFAGFAITFVYGLFVVLGGLSACAERMAPVLMTNMDEAYAILALLSLIVYMIIIIPKVSDALTLTRK